MDKSPIIEIKVDDQWLEELAKDYLKQLYSERLKPEWLTVADLEQITRHEKKWIIENIINDPYVQKNGIAKKAGVNTKSKWIVDAERIRPFLKRLFAKFPDK
ncbi:DUF771 domain-containing protein [Enterococcus innesii]|uniref:DUF771 domain-containing protein n=1 Tax=Enterococcus innesii TaxID=2839759 RepID=UPI003BBD58E0